MGDDGSYDAAAATHRILRAIRQELARHPLVTEVRGFPSGEFTQIVATLAPERVTGEHDEATLTVRWHAGETPDARATFSFHYSDSKRDFGWHYEPNPHVEGWGHFQERHADETEYSYESHTFGSHTPTRLVWEIMSYISARLQTE